MNSLLRATRDMKIKAIFFYFGPLSKEFKCRYVKNFHLGGKSTKSVSMQISMYIRQRKLELMNLCKVR